MRRMLNPDYINRLENIVANRDQKIKELQAEILNLKTSLELSDKLLERFEKIIDPLIEWKDLKESR